MIRDRYTPSDPSLASWDHGVAELRVDGELRAYLACVVGTRWGGEPWPWFVVVWPDGRKEAAEEDYGPDWPTVRALDEGHFTYSAGPSRAKRLRPFGIDLGTVVLRDEHELTYDVTWLPPSVAAVVWERLGLVDSDF